MKLFQSFFALNILFLFVYSIPSTCYSRVVALSKDITESYNSMLRSIPPGRCEHPVTPLYLDVHNSCVMSKLRDFISAPKCGRLTRVTANKARTLYRIMSTVCKKDLVFFTDDCEALEHPPTPAPTAIVSR